VAQFHYTDRFIALMLNAEGKLLKYFHLNGVPNEI